MKYRVEITEESTKIFFVDAMNPADALAHANIDGGNLKAMRTTTHTETHPVDDHGNMVAIDDRPMRY